MCGIVGYVGCKQANSILYEMLKKVEYRGYDSVGIATIDNNKIRVTKTSGEVNALYPLLSNDQSGVCGIGHTRWATHGKASTLNAHPHLSTDKTWAVVHNGIIENYLELKSLLQKNKKIVFQSDTDTEVIAQLLSTQTVGSPMEKIKAVCKQLKGTYALAILNKNSPYIYLAKNGSPLHIGVGKDETYIASDPICFSSKCKKFITLDDGEFARVNGNSIEVYDKHLVEIVKELQKPPTTTESKDKNNYSHLMEKEILETKDALNKIYHTYTAKMFEELLDKDVLKKTTNILLIGCGTAYHASLMGERFFEKYSKISSKAYIASELRYNNIILKETTLAILVSQSGETADTIGALDVLKSKGIPTIAVTNSINSTLSKRCDFVLPILAGVERAVASTKAYTAQIATIYLLSKYIFSLKEKLPFSPPTELSKATFPHQQYLPLINELSAELKNASNVFFIGKDLDYVTALEASLKLKEITYINSSAYPSGELKHGFLALVDASTIVFAIATDERLLTKTLNSAHEISARGGKVILVTDLNVSHTQIKNISKVVKLKNTSSELSPILSIPFFQWLAYYTSIDLGINPDKPRNLAKSVTVE